MRFEGNGVVWDKDRNKPLCRFNNGIFVTTNPYIKKKLMDLGYLYEDDEFTKVDDNNEVIEEVEEVEETKEEVKPDLQSMSFNQLKNYCKNKHYTGYGNCKTTNAMRTFIENKEA